MGTERLGRNRYIELTLKGAWHDGPYGVQGTYLVQVPTLCMENLLYDRPEERREDGRKDPEQPWNRSNRAWLF